MPRIKFASPEDEKKWKEEKRIYNQQYKQTPKYRNYLKEKRKRPDQIEYNKNYLKRPEVKERYKPKRSQYHKERKKDPEVAKKLKDYNAEWAKRPEVKERRNKAKRDKRKKLKLKKYYSEKYEAQRRLELLHQQQVDRVIQKLKLIRYCKQQKIKNQKIQLAIDLNFVLNRKQIYKWLSFKMKIHNIANGETNGICRPTIGLATYTFGNRTLEEVDESKRKCSQS